MTWHGLVTSRWLASPPGETSSSSDLCARPSDSRKFSNLVVVVLAATPREDVEDQGRLGRIAAEVAKASDDVEALEEEVAVEEESVSGLQKGIDNDVVD